MSSIIASSVRIFVGNEFLVCTEPSKRIAIPEKPYRSLDGGTHIDPVDVWFTAVIGSLTS